jgi:ankyrin repeat protein
MISVLVACCGVALTVYILLESIIIVLYSNFILYTDFPGSASIVGSSGSTLFHFAATNGRTNVVGTLLLHATHTDQANNHRVIPEMPVHETGKEWTAKVLTE